MTSRADREGFPWADAMAFGLGVLHLSPADFWAMTPRELAAAMNAADVLRAGHPTWAAAPDRTDLEALMRDHPDAT